MADRLEAIINPELLRWARESIRMEPHEAAARLGVSPDRVADWEDGISRPTITQLRKASEVYRRPLAAFYLPAPPKAFRVPHDFRRLPSQARMRFSPELNMELRRVQYQREVAMELSDRQSYPIDSLVGSVNPAMKPDDVAATLRRELGIGDDAHAAWVDAYAALNGWKNAIEQLGVLVVHFEGVPVAEARGFSLSERPFPCIAVNGSDSPLARVFTLLHEFVHLLLDTAGVCDMAERHRHSDRDDQIETFCNRVAGAAMVPTDALLAHPMVSAHSRHQPWEDWELQSLSQYFRASREVVLLRLIDVGRSTRSFYEQFRESAAAVVHERSRGFLPMPRRILRRTGQPFARMVIGAFYSDRITASDLAEYLGARLKHLPALEQLLEGHNVLTGGDR